MRKYEGVKIGLLTVINYSHSDNGAVWNCKCDCGNEIKRRGSAITKAIKNNYKNTSCGCVKGNQSIARKNAIEKNATTYISETECQKGHGYTRYTSSASCVECHRLLDLELRPSRLQYFKDYQSSHREAANLACKKYRENNKEKVKESMKRYRESEHGKSVRAMNQRLRYARSRVDRSDRISRKFIKNLLDNQSGKCAECKCKVSKYHVDHIMPISLGGENSEDNLQILCPKCNMSKSNKDPLEWAKLNGRLL